MIYLDPRNKWCLVFEDNKGKRHYCAIPPTNGNRTDIINKNDIKGGYTIDVDIIVIKIIDGEPKILNV